MSGANRPASQRRQFTTKALNDLNPARQLIDKRKELELDDAEHARLDTVAKWLDARIAAQMKRADSLEGVIAGAAGISRAGATATKVDSAKQAKQDAAVERAQAARRDFVSLLIDIKADFDSTATRANAAVSEAHRSKASDYVGWAIEDLSTLLREAETEADGQATGRRGGG